MSFFQIWTRRRLFKTRAQTFWSETRLSPDFFDPGAALWPELLGVSMGIGLKLSSFHLLSHISSFCLYSFSTYLCIYIYLSLSLHSQYIYIYICAYSFRWRWQEVPERFRSSQPHSGSPQCRHGPTREPDPIRAMQLCFMQIGHTSATCSKFG